MVVQRCVRLIYSSVHRVSSPFHSICRGCARGLEVDEIDIRVGVSEHVMSDWEAQETINGKIAAGDYDIVIFALPRAILFQARRR